MPRLNVRGVRKLKAWKERRRLHVEELVSSRPLKIRMSSSDLERERMIDNFHVGGSDGEYTLEQLMRKFDD